MTNVIKVAVACVLLLLACGGDSDDKHPTETSAEARTQVSIDDRARACDLLLVEGDSPVADVHFGEGVQGTYVREAPRVAISLIAMEDTALPAAPVDIRFASGAGDVSLSDVRCADASGDVIDDPKVTLGR
ncbi:MAG: hypothetical protein OXU20_15535 [Myxococcales bacterium]|nr:hypothetical protein [Myxococcales bacterium]